MATTVEFTAHNIRLSDGTYTIPQHGWTMDEVPWLISARRILELVFPGDRSQLRIVDLGCLEGGFTTAFARMGFESVGIEIRESNIAACRHVQENCDLPNLQFIQDDAWNVSRYGPFDATFCCGLFYHLDRPKKFLELLSEVTSKVLILQTHFSTDQPGKPFHNLTEVCEHEGLRGRWFTEFDNQDEFQNRENAKWSSWDNHRSFWVQREYLLQAMYDAGFDTVLEQFDGLGWPAGEIVESMTKGWYKVYERGTFIGIKTGVV